MEETNYQNNKDIKVRKRGRPKKVKPTPTIIVDDVLPVVTPVVELTEQEQLEEWVKNNRAWFFNYGKKDRKDLEKVYRLYNILFNTNRRVGSCGGCHLNIMRTIKEKYYG
jgi:hypothetical protein